MTWERYYIVYSFVRVSKAICFMFNCRKYNTNLEKLMTLQTLVVIEFWYQILRWTVVLGAQARKGRSDSQIGYDARDWCNKNKAETLLKLNWQRSIDEARDTPQNKKMIFLLPMKQPARWLKQDCRTMEQNMKENLICNSCLVEKVSHSRCNLNLREAMKRCIRSRQFRVEMFYSSKFVHEVRGCICLMKGFRTCEIRIKKEAEMFNDLKLEDYFSTNYFVPVLAPLLEGIGLNAHTNCMLQDRSVKCGKWKKDRRMIIRCWIHSEPQHKCWH